MDSLRFGITILNGIRRIWERKWKVGTLKKTLTGVQSIFITLVSCSAKNGLNAGILNLFQMLC